MHQRRCGQEASCVATTTARGRPQCARRHRPGPKAGWPWVWAQSVVAIWISIWPLVLPEIALLLAGERCSRKRSHQETAENGRFLRLTRRCNWAPDSYSPREFKRRPGAIQGTRLNVYNACLCTRVFVRRRCRRRRRNADVVAALRVDIRHHVLSDSATAAEAREAASGDGQERTPRRHRRYQWWPCRKGHQGDR